MKTENSEPDSKDYYLKSATNGFLPNEMIMALEYKTKVSKKQMFEGDKYSLIITFRNTLTRLSDIVIE